jgi:4-hydroxy-tetrahydrodipicolinate reductase
MKICIIGYGKMGKMVEKIAMSKGHSINQIIDSPNDEIDGNADVAIIFSTPESAVPNIIKCFEKKLPVVCGTTGWLNDIEKN